MIFSLTWESRESQVPGLAIGYSFGMSLFSRYFLEYERNSDPLNIFPWMLEIMDWGFFFERGRLDNSVMPMSVESPFITPRFKERRWMLTIQFDKIED